MYQYLTGKLITKTPTAIVLDVNGVGYDIQIPLSTYSLLPATMETVRVLTHFVVKEDAHFLCGFFTEEERQLFRQLISVSGIGPKMAMTVLSGIPVQELKRAIIDGAVHVLTGISGIGKKTAERLIIELREKIVLDERRMPVSVKLGASADDDLIEDSLRALVELGYRKQNAKEAIEKVLKGTEVSKLSVADLIRSSLKYI